MPGREARVIVSLEIHPALRGRNLLSVGSCCKVGRVGHEERIGGLARALEIVVDVVEKVVILLGVARLRLLRLLDLLQQGAHSVVAAQAAPQPRLHHPVVHEKAACLTGDQGG